MRAWDNFVEREGDQSLAGFDEFDLAAAAGACAHVKAFETRVGRV